MVRKPPLTRTLIVFQLFRSDPFWSAEVSLIVCSPAAFAAEKPGIPDQWPDQISVLTLGYFAEVCIAITVIAASARLVAFLAHNDLLDVRDFMLL
jgi:hypothetical protein